MQVIEYQANNFNSKLYLSVNGFDLKQLREKKGITQGVLAAQTGIPQGSISRIESSGEEIKKVETLKKLESFFKNEELNSQFGENNRAGLQQPDPNPYKKLPPRSNGIILGNIGESEGESPFIDMGNGQYIMVVPLVPIRAQAGYINHYGDEQYLADNFTQKHSFAVSKVYRGKYMAFIVDGDSMDDGTKEAIPEGSTVTGREIQRTLWRNKFHIHRYKDYIIVHKDGIFIKQITKHDMEEGIITCHSLNPDKDLYPDFDLNLDECLQIFNVVNVTQTK